MNRSLMPLAAVLAVLGLSACNRDEPSDKQADPACTFEPAEVFAGPFPGGTEGVTFAPDGRLFVSDKDAVLALDEAGQVLSTVDLEGALGLAWWRDRVVVAAANGVYSIDGNTPELIATGIDAPNFVAVTPWDTLLVSDDFDTWIYEIDRNGAVSAWLEIPSPNGMVFVDDALWVATTFETPAPIWRVPLDGETPGEPEVIVEYPAGNVPDGLAADADGNVFVALNVAGRIEQVAADGTTTLAGEVPWVASLAFDPRADCRMIATSLLGTEVWALAP